ncbi:MAG: Thivi_2564 family membrane protein [Nitrospirota bacterium]
MSLIHLVIILVVVGVILWLINTYIPMQATIKKLLNAVVVIGVILWLLSALGLLDSIRGIRIGR